MYTYFYNATTQNIAGHLLELLNVKKILSVCLCFSEKHVFKKRLTALVIALGSYELRKFAKVQCETGFSLTLCTHAGGA